MSAGEDRTLVENSPTAVSVVQDGNLVYVNNAFVELLDADEQSELLGTPYIDHVHPDSMESVRTRLQNVQEGELASLHEGKIVTRDDDIKHVKVVATLVEWDDAAATQIQYMDITDRQQQERGLEVFHRAVDTAPVGMVITDPAQDDNPIIYANMGFQRLTGYSEDEIVGQNCRFLQGEKTAEEPIERMRNAIDEQESVSVELRNYRKDDSEFWNHVTIAPVRNEQGDVTHYVGFQQDITERKTYEQELEVSDRAIGQAPLGVMITDPYGTIEHVNPQWEDDTGYSREEAIGERPHIIKSGKHTEEFYEDMWETILAGEIWESEIINQRKTGELYQVNLTITPITNEYGKTTHFVGIEHDITDWQLRKQRLDVLNRILRHNVRNSMNVAQGNASLLVEELDNDLQEQAAAIKDQVDDLLELTEKVVTVRDLFDQKPDTKRNYDVREFLTDVAAELEEKHPNATINSHLQKNTFVQADDRLERALREVIENAIVHNDQPNPEVTITVESPEASKFEDWIEIRIADNGPGIPEQEQTVITAGEETPLLHGTGIGLWMVYWTIVSFGGEMNIDENEPRGTIVTLRVPIATE